MLWSPSGSFTSELGSVTNGIVWFPCQMAIRNYWISLDLPLLKTLIRSKASAVLITVSKFNTPHRYSCTEEQGRKEMFYLMMHSTHFIYGYLASDIFRYWKRKETRCCHISYSFRLAARVLLYALSHTQDSTYHGLCYTSRGALAATRNSSIGLPWRIDPTTHRTISKRSPTKGKRDVAPW